MHMCFCPCGKALEEMRHYAKHCKLPRKTKLKINKYFRLCFPTKRSFNEDPRIDSQVITIVTCSFNEDP